MADHEPRKRSWTTAIPIAASVIVTLLFLMYAFVQKAEVDAQRKHAEEFMRQSDANSQRCIEDHKQLIDSIKTLQAKLESLKTDGKTTR